MFIYVLHSVSKFHFIWVSEWKIRAGKTRSGKYVDNCTLLFVIKGSGSTDIGNLELLTLGYKADFSESNYVLHLSRFTLVAEIFEIPQGASSQTLFYRYTPESFHY